MMNKKRTRSIYRVKYLALLPLVVLLLFISNIEIIARTTLKQTKEFTATKTESETFPATSTFGALAEKEDAISIEKDPVFQVVEQMPQFPGGGAAIMKYFSEQINYPEEALQNRVEGRVIAQFTIKKDGSISDINIVRKVDPALDLETERVIAAMPKWQPGKQNGQVVNVKFTLPVIFKLP